MRILELFESVDYLQQFWKTQSPENLRHYFDVGGFGCSDASLELQQFLQSKGIQSTRVAPGKLLPDGKKKNGWIKVDTPDYSYEAFSSKELADMKQSGLNPKKKSDRIAYANDKNLVDELTWIPHSWVEVKGQILDPSGFYPDNKSGQFDKLVKDKSNVASRYKKF